MAGLNGGTVVGAVLLLAFLVGTAPAVSAAGGVSVDATPETDDVKSGETTTFDVVVNSTDVGAIDLTVWLADGSVATIESVDTPADDSNEDITNDGQTATIAAYGLQDAGQSGSTTVATVTVAGTSAGSTTLSLGDVSVADARGDSYRTTVGNATLSVEARGSNGGSSHSHDHADTDDSATDDATATPTPDDGAGATATATTDGAGDGQTDGTAVDPATTADPSSTTTDFGEGSTVTETQTPGFTLGLALLALVTAGLVAARRE